jgi:hypothetical protein
MLTTRIWKWIRKTQRNEGTRDTRYHQIIPNAQVQSQLGLNLRGGTPILSKPDVTRNQLPPIPS